MTVLPKRNASKSKAETNANRLEKKRLLSRALKLETLEKRELFAVDLPAFHNGLIPTDVNLDYSVGPLDVLAIVNKLNENGGSTYLGDKERDPNDLFFDVDGDDFLSPLDALSVINFINSGEGLSVLASIRYQFFAANPDGTPDLTRLLGQTDGATPPVIDIGVGEQIVIRTQMNDLRTTVGLPTYGVFSGYHDLRFENLDNSTSEKLQLMWGEFNEIRIPGLASSGSFSISYAGTAQVPARTVTIQPQFSGNSVDPDFTNVAVRNALEAAFGAGNIQVRDQVLTQDGFQVFRFNFKGSLARLNIGDGTITNNTMNLSGTTVTPEYVGDPNPSPTRLATTSPARNHRLESTFVTPGGSTGRSNIVYSEGVDGAIRGPLNVRLATTTNYRLTTNNFEDIADIDDITSIDGTTVSPGDRILVRSQTNATQNGIYVVTDQTVGSITKRTLIRSLDADESDELLDAFVAVTAGTFAGQTFLQQTPNVNLGSSAIVWGDNDVFVLERLGGFSGTLTGESAFIARQYFNVVDVLYRGGAAGEVRLDAQLSRVPTGSNPQVTQNLGLALYGTAQYITESSLVTLPSNVRIRVLDELTAFPDNFNLLEDAPGTLLDVMANDEDRRDRAFTIINAQTASDKGTVSVASNGTRVLFTPARDANGPVVFTYTIRNTAGNTSEGTVTVNIAPINDPPIPLTPTLSVAEDAPTGLTITPQTLFSPGPADEIAAGQTVSFTGTPTASNGTVTINGDGNLVFNPASNYNGSATISVLAVDSDGAQTPQPVIFTVTVTPVNDPPIVLTNRFETREDVALPAVSATTLFSPGPANEGTQQITLTIQSAPLASQGTASIVNNQLVFTPDNNFFGNAILVVRGTDNGVGTLTNPTAPNPLFTDSTVTINVTPVNDPPIANDDNLSVIAAINIAQTLDVMALGSNSSGRDSAGPREDVAGVDRIRVVSVTQPVGVGTTTARGGTVNVGTDGANVIFTPDGTVIDGVVSFTYTIRDEGGLEDTATVTLQIVPPARPYALDNSFTIDEDAAVQTFDVVANDFVRDGSTAVIDSVATIPISQGTVELVNNRIEFTPAPDFFGTIVFTYNMSDTSGLPPEEDSRQTANVTVIVRELNDDPVAVELTRSTPEDIDLLMSNGSITDGLSRGPLEEEQTLTISQARLVNPVAGTIELRANGDIFFSPADDFFGQAIIEYTVTDNGTNRGVLAPRSSQSRILVNVTPVNDPPVPGNDNVTAVEDTASSYSIATLIGNDSPGPANESAAGQTVSFDGLPSTSSAQGGTLAIVGGNIVYTPASNFFGTDTFTYRVRDSESPALTAIGTVTVTVSEVNDAPVATNVSRGGIFASVRTVIDLTEELALMSRGAPNESGQTLTISAVGVSANGVQPTVGPDGRSIIYTAPLGASGPDSFTYTIVDNGTTNGQSDPRTSSAIVNLNVLPFIPSSFSGRVWIDEDINRNNIIDRGELMLSGVDVYLFEGTMDDPAPRSTWRHEVTDTSGYYSFELLPPGTYTVTFVVPNLMHDSVAANHFTQTIQAPGDVHVTYDFAVYGIQAGLGTQLEYLASSFYQTDAGMRNDGFIGAIASDGTSLWTIARGEFNDDLFHEIVLSNDGRTAFITTIRDNNEVFTASVGRSQFRRVLDTNTGTLLIRVLARDSELNWTRVNMSAPPTNSAARYLDSIDEFFATMEDDPI